MKELDKVLETLQRSAFRQRFRLGTAERAYLDSKGLPAVLAHAEDFIARRLAPAQPPNASRALRLRAFDGH